MSRSQRAALIALIVACAPARSADFVSMEVKWAAGEEVALHVDDQQRIGLMQPELLGYPRPIRACHVRHHFIRFDHSLLGLCAESSASAS
jgi:hypothetical protein